MRAHGRARVSSRNPEAFAACDRCNTIYNHSDLSWQFDYAGISLVNKRILVCHKCLDRPQAQLKAIILPADPMPIANPRVFNYAQADANFRVTSGQDTVDFWTGIPKPGGNLRVLEDDNPRVLQQTGAPDGSLNNEPGTEHPGTDPNDIGLPRGTMQIPKVK